MLGAGPRQMGWIESDWQQDAHLLFYEHRLMLCGEPLRH